MRSSTGVARPDRYRSTTTQQKAHEGMSGQLDSEKENDGAQRLVLPPHFLGRQQLDSEQCTGDLYRKVHQQDQLRKLQEQLEERDR